MLLIRASGRERFFKSEFGREVVDFGVVGLTRVDALWDGPPLWEGGDDRQRQAQ